MTAGPQATILGPRAVHGDVVACFQAGVESRLNRLTSAGHGCFCSKYHFDEIQIVSSHGHQLCCLVPSKVSPLPLTRPLSTLWLFARPGTLCLQVSARLHGRRSNPSPQKKRKTQGLYCSLMQSATPKQREAGLGLEDTLEKWHP